MKTQIMLALLLVMISSFSLGDIEAAIRPILSRESKTPMVKSSCNSI